MKITDFGIAAAKNKLTLTSPGMVLGKTAYMAPEQAQARGVDFTCDVWALGVMLWESLVGERLFAAENPVETLQRVLSADIAPPSSLCADVPVALDALCAPLLQRDRAARPAVTEQVVRALDAVVAQLARTSPLPDDGVFGAPQLARFLAGIAWTDDTAPLRPRARHDPRVAAGDPTARRPAKVPDDAELQGLLDRCRSEQDPWLLVDVGDRAVALGHPAIALSAYRTAAAAFAFRGLLVQCLVAHAGARGLLPADDAREDILLLCDLTPGRVDEHDELLRTFDTHGFAGLVSREELPLPPPVPLLGALGPRELARVAEVVSICRVRQGDVVIREGEAGNVLYAIAPGRFVVSRSPGDETNMTSVSLPTPEADWESDATANESGIRVDTALLARQRQERVFLAGLADGDFFGEFSFLVERPRSATVEAVTDGVILEIERGDVEHIAAVDPAFTASLLAFYKERVVELMMVRSPVFSLLSPAARKGLLDGALTVDVDDGALIVREGTRNDAVFFIRRGEVEVFRKDKDGLTIFINKLGQGQFFGEIAALKGTPRTVSVRAIGPMSLFQIEGRLLHAIVDREPRLRLIFDDMIARRAAETRARVLEYDRVVFGS